MSSLPHISHRLFVAAVRHDVDARPKRTTHSARNQARQAETIPPLEVLQDAGPAIERVPQEAQAEVCLI